MNVRRFTARNSRDALMQVRQTLGEDAVILSTKPCEEGVEVLALGPEGLQQLARSPRQPGQAAQAGPMAPAARREPMLEPAAVAAVAAPVRADATVQDDVEQLQMSTLSFQDYVRQRMKRREAAEVAGLAKVAMAAQPGGATARPLADPLADPVADSVANGLVPASVLRTRVRRGAAVAAPAAPQAHGARPGVVATPAMPAGMPSTPAPAARYEPPVLREEMLPLPPQPALAWSGHTAARLSAGLSDGLSAGPSQLDLMDEMRAMRSLIEDRFGALAFMEKLQRHPRQAQLTQRLIDAGFSPQLVRHLIDGLPTELPAGLADDLAWAAGVLERNLSAAEPAAALEDTPGVYALIGPTGVGKTTSTAKLAAAFAARHGATQLGLITLDAYRMGAHEQLRSYGRILGVPVHTAHDRASLEDLLELLAGKRMVIIDTAGMAPRDTRTRELLEMLSHPSIRKVLVASAAAQAETLEDVMPAYRASQCAGVVLSKLDEAVKLGPALDVLIRHRLKVLAVANGQRVPEDWHRLSANALVHRALRAGPGGAWRLDAGEINLVFAAHTRPLSAPARAAGHMPVNLPANLPASLPMNSSANVLVNGLA